MWNSSSPSVKQIWQSKSTKQRLGGRGGRMGRAGRVKFISRVFECATGTPKRPNLCLGSNKNSTQNIKVSKYWNFIWLSRSFNLFKLPDNMPFKGNRKSWQPPSTLWSHLNFLQNYFILTFPLFSFLSIYPYNPNSLSHFQKRILSLEMLPKWISFSLHFPKKEKLFSEEFRKFSFLDIATVRKIEANSPSQPI